ncbi:TIGR03943 family putative permease subunit [Ectobacillus panaciterrae]|uniref:TIGR03943 family putative permease subunit n=1 Tax=Ectobacillus panaciterrae TaxID=363872 RepID=UPI00040865B0|nr:TIGR03943 family protein [Ectobacillus panaciterrae]
MRDRESFHMYIRGIIMLGFGMLLFKLLITGDIENFIAPKMLKFIGFTLFVSLLLGSMQILRSGEMKQYHCECGNHSLPKTTIGSISLYALFLLPIVSAFLFSGAAIDGKVAAKRGVTLTGVQQAAAPDKSVAGLLSDTEEQPPQTIQQPPKGYYENLERKLLGSSSIEVNDDNYISAMDVIGQDVEGFAGKQISFTGFVHREEDLGKDKIVIARYGITCCVADASVLGMLAVGLNTSSLQEGEWIQVTGTLGKTTYIDTLLPIVQLQKIEKVAAPKTQYVYQKF